jgi:His/Glu/Gln/Arg/opine family amino acid ABC transporter permease subunit
VPDLVLILLIYFGGQRAINDVGDLLGWSYIELSKFWAGVFAIGFIYGAYLTETFRGAWSAVPPGQAEAARALGMRGWVIFLRVTGPQAVRHALPGYGNVWQVLVKSTAVVSVIGLDDLVGLADKAGKSTREPFLFFIAVILVYLAITSSPAAPSAGWSGAPRRGRRHEDRSGPAELGDVRRRRVDDAAIDGAVGGVRLLLRAAGGAGAVEGVALRAAGAGYVYFFRGTPLLVQTYLIYYGLSQFDWLRASPLWIVLRDPWWCALIAFSLNSGAYAAEILRGAFAATPRASSRAAGRWA